MLDWSFTGHGAVGEDVPNLIIDSCTDGLMEMALLPELAESATDGYLRGLPDGGWTGSSDAVRTIIAACGAAKHSWFAPMIVGRAARSHWTVLLRPGHFGRCGSTSGYSTGRTHRRLGGGASLLGRWSASPGSCSATASGCLTTPEDPASAWSASVSVRLHWPPTSGCASSAEPSPPAVARWFVH